MKLKWDIVKCGIGMGYCKNLQYWNEAQYKLSVVLEWDTVKDCGIGMGHIKKTGIGMGHIKRLWYWTRLTSFSPGWSWHVTLFILFICK